MRSQTKSIHHSMSTGRKLQTTLKPYVLLLTSTTQFSFFSSPSLLLHLLLAQICPIENYSNVQKQCQIGFFFITEIFQLGIHQDNAAQQTLVLKQ